MVHTEAVSCRVAVIVSQCSQARSVEELLKYTSVFLRDPARVPASHWGIRKKTTRTFNSGEPSSIMKPIREHNGFSFGLC